MGIPSQRQGGNVFFWTVPNWAWPHPVSESSLDSGVTLAAMPAGHDDRILTCATVLRQWLYTWACWLPPAAFGKEIRKGTRIVNATGASALLEMRERTDRASRRGWCWLLRSMLTCAGMKRRSPCQRVTA